MADEVHHAMRRARDLSRLFDAAFRVPGTNFRFGLDPLLGLIPGVGDVIAGGVGVYLLVLGFRLGAPPIVLVRMFGRFIIDLTFGAIPILGDLMDAGYKSNLRNLDLLESHLARPQETRRSSLVAVAVLSVGLLAVLGGAVWIFVEALAWIVGLFG